jgi:hypothetical protein
MGRQKTRTRGTVRGVTGVENLEGRRMMSGVPAFPGAEGYGANATGGRGGTIVHVTNLNDSGPGSFRDAVSHSNRIVVFDVGGYVNLQSAVSVSGNITILGQTAPGDGIGFMGREVSFSNKSNDIVQYVRFRQGDLDPDTGKSSLAFSNATNMIFDHVSVQFGQWDNVDSGEDTSATPQTFTIQNSLLAGPIGQQFNAHIQGASIDFTWANNLFVDGHNRNPLTKADSQFVNNVVYNWELGGFTTHSSSNFKDDVINNYFISGPSSGSHPPFYQVDSAQKVYMSGNLWDNTPGDGKLNGSTYNSIDGGTRANSVQLGTDALATMTAAEAYDYVVANAGASLHRDQVDGYFINEVLSKGTLGKMWKSQTADGLGNNGYGIINGGTLPTDTDGDGIADYWELANGLNPKSAGDAALIDSATGYAFIEEYASYLAAGGTAAAPEPGTVLALAAGAGVLAARRGRRRHVGAVEVGGVRE